MIGRASSKIIITNLLKVLQQCNHEGMLYVMVLFIGFELTFVCTRNTGISEAIEVTSLV